MPLFSRAFLRLFLVLCACALFFTSVRAEKENAVLPTQTIDLAAQGFKSVSTWQESFADDLGAERYASQFAIEFMDEQHLLVAFSGHGLVKRLPECPASHHDRVVQAMVVELPSGRVVRRAEWYLHDHRRFLWPLASGGMLLRRGDVLYLVDAELRERELYRSAKPLEWVSTTAEGNQILMETAASAETQAAERTARYELRSVDATTGEVKATLPLTRLIPITTTSSGFPDAVAGIRGKTWLVRYGATPKGRLPITRVRTACTPTVEFSGANTMIIARCSSSGTAYSVSSFTNSGHFLWRRRWDHMRWVPLIERSASGLRFALATVSREAEESKTAAKKDGEEEEPFTWTQRIEVLDAMGGATLLSVDTKPAIFAGQGFALSPQGTQFAVLRGTSVEVHALPKPTREDEAKLAAVLADVPGLIPPSDESYQELAESIDTAGDTPAGVPATVGVSGGVQPPAIGVDRAPVALAPTPAVPTTVNPVATFRTGTQAVVLEVVVTDRKGKPVTGLSQDQFTVLEDGAKQSTRFFEEHLPEPAPKEAQKETAPKAAKAPAAAPKTNTFSNVSQRKDVDSSTMLMLDLLNTPMEDRQRVREEVIKFIKNKPANENFALCVLGNNLRLVRGFTTDEQTLIAGVQEKRGNLPSIGSANDRPNARLIEDMQQTLATLQLPNERLARFAANAQQNLIDDRSEQQDMRVRVTFDAFQQVARYLAGIPGRKNLVWLSSSFPTVVFAATDGGGTNPFRQQRDWSDDVKKLTNMLAAGHVAVYPIDIRGVQADSMFDSSNMQSPTFVTPGMSPTQGSATAVNLNQHMQAPNQLSVDGRTAGMQRDTEHATMDVIAEQTGGKAFYGSNDLAQSVHASVQHGTSYYTVSYSPSNKQYKGEFRKIRVQVAGGDYRLAYRTGYFAEDPNKPLPSRGGVEATLASAAMAHGAPESGQVPFMARVVPVGEPKMTRASSKGKAGISDVKVQHYVVNYVVSGTQLRYTTMADGNLHGEFNFLIRAYDADGVLMSQTASKAVSDPKADQFENILRTGFRIRQEVDVPVRATSMRLGVEDISSAHIGTLELALPVPVPKEEPLARKAKTLPPVEPE